MRTGAYGGWSLIPTWGEPRSARENRNAALVQLRGLKSLPAGHLCRLP